MENVVSTMMALAGTGRKNSSRGKSAVSEGREKPNMEAWSDGDEGDHEKTRKEEAMFTTPLKKGGRSDKMFQCVEDIDVEIRCLNAPPRLLIR